MEWLAGKYNDMDWLRKNIDLTTKEHLKQEDIVGKKIFLKPNWVKHSAIPSDEICLRTHDNFVLAFLENILCFNPSQVTIGDAPIQGCKWDEMIRPSFIAKIGALSHKYNISIQIKDLRRLIMNLNSDDMVNNVQSLDDFIIFDVGKKSYLEPITHNDKNQFRVTHYNPDRFKLSHGPGVHKYCITKELFEADVVISMPKMKTHEKAGITNALKNIVGLNGDKDFLPHHRIGGTDLGGDSYPGKNYFRHFSEICYDQANRNLGNKSYWVWVRLASLLWKVSSPTKLDRFGAGWHGNQTTWRMVMDLNLIAFYGKSDGTLSSTPVRQLFSLSDGIVGGQKDGPLTPTPLALGLISFTNDSALCDLSIGTLMGMNIDKVPLLVSAKEFRPFEKKKIFYNDKEVTLNQLQAFSVDTEMPSGWLGYEKVMNKV